MGGSRGSAPITQGAVEHIKRMIAEGELRPGQQLPTERELAAQLGLSRSSMREAIRVLSTIGILHTRQGSGVYVTALGPEELLASFGALAELSRGQTLVEVLQVRRMLEPAATALAAARISDSALQALRAALHDIAVGEDLAVTADLAFHEAIVAAAGNSTLLAIHRGLSSRALHTRVWRGHRASGAQGRLRADHERIYRALADRDPAAAEAAASAHLLEVEAWVAEHRADFS